MLFPSRWYLLHAHGRLNNFLPSKFACTTFCTYKSIVHWGNIAEAFSLSKKYDLMFSIICVLLVGLILSELPSFHSQFLTWSQQPMTFQLWTGMQFPYSQTWLFQVFSVEWCTTRVVATREAILLSWSSENWSQILSSQKDFTENHTSFSLSPVPSIINLKMESVVLVNSYFPSYLVWNQWSGLVWGSLNGTMAEESQLILADHFIYNPTT